ncbi:aminopeptidase-like protein AC3.5 [Ditylenchus destructor]|uniref:Aminopeptidase-like protein AC3.5 n=1 Tax=Ditylenchus destructor TaxID=166010 RepID=A0AAD4MLS5_9BILA|nr:aminopeptidase-like protein AC3.5 [Ditylenchus destructor]
MDLEISDNQKFLVDPRSYGFYRVKYSNELLAQIGVQLRKDHTAIEPIARARVLDDTFHMAEAGLLPHQTALELSSYATKETDDLPAITVLKHLDRLQAEFFDSEPDEVDRANASEDPVEKYKENFLDNLISHTEEHSQRTLSNRGLEKESFTHNGLSKVIAEEQRKTQHNATIVKDIEMFQEEFVKPCSGIGEDDFLPRNGCSRVPFASRHYVYCQGIRHGGPREFGLVLRIYQKEYMSASEKHSLLNALTCSQNETALKWYTLKHLTALNRPVGKRLLFNWVLENWEDVCRRFKDEVRQLGKVLGASLSRGTDHAIQTLTKFIEDHPTASHLHALKPLLNRLKKKREFVIKTSSSLLEWFGKQKY